MSGQQHAPLAAAAFQTNIRSKPRYLPFNPPTRMRLAQLYNVAQLQVWQHKKDYTTHVIIMPMLGVSAATFISRAITLIIAFTVHEFSHAWTATYFGDDTPRAHGRLTLNPIAHLDLMGSLMLLVAGFGWAKPVPVNPFALQRRSSAALMLVSLAGPLSNLLLAILAAVFVRLDLVPDIRLASFLPSASDFVFQFIIINLTLMLFNLIPLAPLDGDAIADYFLPPSWQNTMQRIRPYGPIILLVMLFVLPYLGIDILGLILLPPLRALYTLLTGG